MKCGSCRTSKADRYEKVDSGRLFEILKNLNSRRQYDPRHSYFCGKCIAKAKKVQDINDVSDQNANSLTLTSKDTSSSTVSSKDEYDIMVETKRSFTDKGTPILPVKRPGPRLTGPKPCPKRFKLATELSLIEENSGEQNEAPPVVSTEETSPAQGHDKSKEPDNSQAPTIPTQDTSSEQQHDLEMILDTPTSAENLTVASSNHSDSSSNEDEAFVELGDSDASSGILAPILPNESLSPDRVVESGTRQPPNVSGTVSDKSQSGSIPEQRPPVAPILPNESLSDQSSESLPEQRPPVVKEKTRTQPPRRASKSSSESDRSTSSNGSKSKKSRPTSGGKGKRNPGPSTTSGSSRTDQRPQTSTTSGRMEPQSSTRPIDDDSDSDSHDGTVSVTAPAVRNPRIREPAPTTLPTPTPLPAHLQEFFKRGAPIHDPNRIARETGG